MTLEELADKVGEVFGLDIRSKSRRQENIVARCIYYKLAYDDLVLGSLDSVGLEVGKEHATVIHSLKNIFPTINTYFPSDYKKYVNLKESLLANYGDKMDSVNHIISSYETLLESYRVALFDDTETVAEEGIDSELMQLVFSVEDDKKELLLERLKPIVRIL
jgi:chromosomal replication initiation ATPase DnaA